MRLASVEFVGFAASVMGFEEFIWPSILCRSCLEVFHREVGKSLDPGSCKRCTGNGLAYPPVLPLPSLLSIVIIIMICTVVIFLYYYCGTIAVISSGIIVLPIV